MLPLLIHFSKQEMHRTLTCSFSNCIIFLKKSTENGRLSCKLKRKRKLLSSTSLLHPMNIKHLCQCLHDTWLNKDLATIQCKDWTGPPATLNTSSLQLLILHHQQTPSYPVFFLFSSFSLLDF